MIKYNMTAEVRVALSEQDPNEILNRGMMGMDVSSRMIGELRCGVIPGTVQYDSNDFTNILRPGEPLSAATIFGAVHTVATTITEAQALLGYAIGTRGAPMPDDIRLKGPISLQLFIALYSEAIQAVSRLPEIEKAEKKAYLSLYTELYENYSLRLNDPLLHQMYENQAPVNSNNTDVTADGRASRGIGFSAIVID